MQEFWIGDRVQVISSGRKGIYEGKFPGGKAKIKIDGNHVSVSYNDLRLLPDEAFSSIKDIIVPDFNDRKIVEKFETVIDLHLDKLAPEHLTILPQRRLDFQISKCKNFIEKAIKLRKHEVTIIHGLGKGLLKSEVEHLLSFYPEVKFFVPIHNGGAKKVVFQY